MVGEKYLFVFVVILFVSVDLTTAISPFKVNFSEEEVTNVIAKVKTARLHSSSFGDWDYGVNKNYFEEFLSYWVNNYNWTQQQEYLNQYPQFTTKIRDLNLHYLHVLANTPNPSETPIILLIHGWPGSVIEFYTMIPTLIKGDIKFNVVAPSLPGYWFSEASETTGMDAKLIADHFIELMAKLGYKKYLVHGGDWGGIIGSFVAVNDPSHCLGFHTTMPGLSSAPLNKGFFRLIKTVSQLIFPSYFFDEYDRGTIKTVLNYILDGAGYFHIQATRPHTIGFALSDSPVGLAAYLLEKFRDWSDNHPNYPPNFQLTQNENDLRKNDNELIIDRDILITNIMVYHLTNTITSSMRLYYEFAHSSEGMMGTDKVRYVSVPTAVLYFEKEIIKSPRDWIESTYNLVRYNRHPVGGHFAGLEQPSVVVSDIRSFYDQLKPQNNRIYENKSEEFFSHSKLSISCSWSNHHAAEFTFLFPQFFNNSWQRRHGVDFKSKYKID